jgi:MoxR-like ATPase
MDQAHLTRELNLLSGMYRSTQESLNAYIVGNETLIRILCIGLLSGGHVLIEGAPGTAKTSIAKAMARITGCEFRRVQCAVDTQPADIIGIRVYDPEEKDFILRKGPVFTNILLIDEINRLNPKTQTAFIEVMSEQQATIDGTTLNLNSPFFSIATQNPYEYEGTFPLIEAQKDRFMFSHISNNLSSSDELEVIRRENSGMLRWQPYHDSLRPILNSGAITHLREVISQTQIAEPVLAYIRDLVVATREHSDIRMGASSRASIAMVRGGKSLAALQQRSYVLPDDIKAIAPAVLQHRLLLEREAEIGGITPDQIVREILSSVEVP